MLQFYPQLTIYGSNSSNTQLNLIKGGKRTNFCPFEGVYLSGLNARTNEQTRLSFFVKFFYCVVRSF